MTQQILRIDSSVFGSNGQSSQLADALVEHIKAEQKGSIQPIEVTTRDLTSQPLPHLDMNILGAIGTPDAERSEQQRAWANMADEVIEEVRAADIVILAAPMYNFSVPSTVKSWMDYVARAGETFRYTANGPEGLLTGKKVFVISPRGGLHKGTPADTITGFVNTFLGFVGITDVQWIYAEGVNMSDHKEAAIAQAKAEIAAIKLA